MDSRLAADPVARQIIESLATLEKAAGVRAHYRILDPPPLTSTDASAIQTVARVLGDWIGLRNAMFDITIVEHDDPPRMFRIDPDQEVFAMELSSKARATPATALAAVTRQVSRAYLINSNIAASSVDPERSSGSMADITAIFLGMGKLVMNAPAAGSIGLSKSLPQTPENLPLSPEYLAFAHRLVCAMRGLDWAQNASGMNSQALANLRKWDHYRDSVFSQALRNVLTASASHRPLMDAVEDNHLALSRFDQLQRSFSAMVMVPLQAEMETYHQTCREGMERLNAREQDTYDPCLLYLNQLRRRMDLQRYADMLQVQQDHIVNRLRVLTAGLTDLSARNLVHPDAAEGRLNVTHCPFDGTPLTMDDSAHDVRVKCPTCGYGFLAIPGVPNIQALRARPVEAPEPEGPVVHRVDDEQVGDLGPMKPQKPAKQVERRDPGVMTGHPGTAGKDVEKASNGAATVLTWGIILLPLSWLPMLIYVLATVLQGKDAPMTAVLGQLGMVGSGIGLLLIIVGSVGLIRRRLSRGAVVREA